MVGKRFVAKRIVVIGGNSGIGLASAKAFAAEGGRVAIVGRNPQTLENAKADIGSDTVAIRADISSLSSIDEAAAAIGKALGGIDVLFAHAGTGAMVPMTQVTESLWDELMNINLKGMYFTVQKLAPLMAEGGAIVLCSSVGAVRSWPGSSVYSASKAAVNALGRAFAAELLSRKIRVNVVMPGGTDTPIMSRTVGVGAEAADMVKQGMAEHTPMGRMGAPEEIAAAVLFLASAEASYITAAELVVDGGVVGCAA